MSLSLCADVIERYETLREHVVHARPGPDHGRGLLVRRGLLAWSQTAQECILSPPAKRLSSAAVMVPDHLSLSLIQMLAGMVLQLHDEVAEHV